MSKTIYSICQNPKCSKELIKWQTKYCSVKCSNSCIEKRNKDSELKKGKQIPWKNGHPRGMLGKSSWNKGLTKLDYSQEHIKSINEAAKKPSHFLGKKHTPEAIEKIKKASVNNGGYRKGSGRGKKGFYRGIWCDSSWELAFVIYNLDHNIPFEKNHKKFSYVYLQQEKKYIPDFKMNDNQYIEIKGFVTDEVMAKIKYFPHKINLIDKDKIEPYIKYAEEKYGKDYIMLYE